MLKKVQTLGQRPRVGAPPAPPPCRARKSATQPSASRAKARRSARNSEPRTQPRPSSSNTKRANALMATTPAQSRRCDWPQPNPAECPTSTSPGAKSGCAPRRKNPNPRAPAASRPTMARARQNSPAQKPSHGRNKASPELRIPPRHRRAPPHHRRYGRRRARCAAGWFPAARSAAGWRRPETRAPPAFAQVPASRAQHRSAPERSGWRWRHNRDRRRAVLSADPRRGQQRRPLRAKRGDEVQRRAHGAEHGGREAVL